MGMYLCLSFDKHNRSTEVDELFALSFGVALSVDSTTLGGRTVNFSLESKWSRLHRKTHDQLLLFLFKFLPLRKTWKTWMEKKWPPPTNGSSDTSVERAITSLTSLIASIKNSRHGIFNNYSPKWRWIVVDKYPPLFTDTEVNNCFSIYHTSWINSGPILKKGLFSGGLLRCRSRAARIAVSDFLL